MSKWLGTNDLDEQPSQQVFWLGMKAMQLSLQVPVMKRKHGNKLLFQSD